MQSVPALAIDAPNVPVFRQKGQDLQKYSDIGRGFQILRPFGFNEFDGVSVNKVFVRLCSFFFFFFFF